MREEPRPPAATKLLDAAQTLLAEGGFRAATSRALAKQAGVNLALINYYFGSKATLLHRAFELVLQRLSVELERLPPQGWLRLATTLADTADGRILLCGYDEALHDETIARMLRDHREVQRQYFERTARSSAGDETTVALALALLNGLLWQRRLDPRTDTRAIADSFENLVGGDSNSPDALDF